MVIKLQTTSFELYFEILFKAQLHKTMINRNNKWIQVLKETIANKEKASDSKELKTIISTESSKSGTTLLLEITRLKTQQRFLEYNLIKLKFSNFSESHRDLKPSCLMISTLESNQSVIHVITELNQLKTQLDKNLQKFCQQSWIEVKNTELKIKQIKEYIQCGNLNEHSIGTLRENVIDINTDIEKLNLQNSNKLKILQNNAQNLYNTEAAIKI